MDMSIIGGRNCRASLDGKRSKREALQIILKDKLRDSDGFQCSRNPE